MTLEGVTLKTFDIIVLEVSAFARPNLPVCGARPGCLDWRNGVRSHPAPAAPTFRQLSASVFSLVFGLVLFRGAFGKPGVCNFLYVFVWDEGAGWN